MFNDSATCGTSSDPGYIPINIAREAHVNKATAGSTNGAISLYFRMNQYQTSRPDSVVGMLKQYKR